MISGIHFGRSKYVYNGWTKNTIDPSFISEGALRVNSCYLMDFECNIKIDNLFSLDSINCKLDFINLKILQFLFGREKNFNLY
jgi:hypothetical protein